MSPVVDRPDLRDRFRVFRDRAHAGEVLADLLAQAGPWRGLVLAVPAGGVPVALGVAKGLGLAVELAVVSKITPVWNSEVGYGAVAFDGSVRLNRPLLREFGLTEDEVGAGIQATARKVARRVRRFRGERPLPDLSEGSAILVDDGLASGFTLRTAAEAVRKAGARSVVVAVPTAHRRAAEETAREVDAVYCASLRSGLPFAVADAYQAWTDLTDDEVARLLAESTGYPGP